MKCRKRIICKNNIIKEIFVNLYKKCNCFSEKFLNVYMFTNEKNYIKCFQLTVFPNLLFLYVSCVFIYHSNFSRLPTEIRAPRKADHDRILLNETFVMQQNNFVPFF